MCLISHTLMHKSLKLPPLCCICIGTQCTRSCAFKDKSLLMFDHEEICYKNIIWLVLNKEIRNSTKYTLNFRCYFNSYQQDPLGFPEKNNPKDFSTLVCDQCRICQINLSSLANRRTHASTTKPSAWADLATQSGAGAGHPAQSRSQSAPWSLCEWLLILLLK